MSIKFLLLLLLSIGLIPRELNASFYKKYTDPLNIKTAENWDNKKYWIEKTRERQEFYCSMMQPLWKKDKKEEVKQNKFSKITEKECNDESFNNSRLGIQIIKTKIAFCNGLMNDDFFRKNRKISIDKKNEIFKECASFYEIYSNDWYLKNHLGQFYKMFFIYKLTKKQVDYELDNWDYKYEKCKNQNEFRKCMGWMHE